MQIKQEQDATVIVFDNPSGGRIQALFSFEALFYFAAAVGFAVGATVALRNDSVIAGLFSFAFAIMFAIAFMRFYLKLSANEQLTIHERSFTIVANANGRKTVTTYDNTAVTDLRYAGRQKMLDHPLKTGGFDYMGFQTQQEVTDNLTAEGNITFEYQERLVRFGIGVPSWDAEKISREFQQRTKGLLFIADLPEDIPESEWMQ